MPLTCSRATRRRGWRSSAPRARSRQPPAGTIAVLDVGGGSTEIAVGEADGAVEWSASFRIGSGFLADSYLRSDPPSVAELDAVRSHVEGAFEGLEPPPAQSAVAVGGTATSLRRLVGAELAHETLERGVRVLSQTADRRGGRAASSSTPSGCSCCRPASSCSRRCRTAWRCPLRIARGGLREGVLLELVAEARAGSVTGRSLRELVAGAGAGAARPGRWPPGRPSSCFTRAPVSACTAPEKSGSWPTSMHLVAEAGGELDGSKAPPDRRSLELGLEARAPRRPAGPCRPRAPAGSSGRRRASRRAPPARRPPPAPARSPFAVSGRSASGEPSAASP